jgi:hypothetical protein
MKNVLDPKNSEKDDSWVIALFVILIIIIIVIIILACIYGNNNSTCPSPNPRHRQHSPAGIYCRNCISKFANYLQECTQNHPATYLPTENVGDIQCIKDAIEKLKSDADCIHCAESFQQIESLLQSCSFSKCFKQKIEDLESKNKFCTSCITSIKSCMNERNKSGECIHVVKCMSCKLELQKAYQQCRPIQCILHKLGVSPFTGT